MSKASEWAAKVLAMQNPGAIRVRPFFLSAEIDSAGQPVMVIGHIAPDDKVSTSTHVAISDALTIARWILDTFGEAP